MRLDRYLSNATHYSRKQIKHLIKAGAVTVAGELALRPDSHVAAGQVVAIDDQSVAAPQPQYLMLNKPRGYVCATEDSQHPVVLDLVTPNTATLQIVGRLDIDTTGLLLLTTDGQWNHRITSPRGQCRKVYRVQLASPAAASDLEQIETGIMLRGESKPTLPSAVTRITDTCLDIEIQEGRYHQIKRMFAAIGNKVIDLHRYQIGQLTLDSQLKPGQFRPLTAKEINLF